MAIDVLLKINSAADMAGIQASVQMLAQLGGAVVDQIKELEKFSKAWNQVEGDIFAADDAAAGLIDTLVLAEQRNKISRAGLKITDKQYAALAKTVAKYAQATGEDATSAMQRFTKSLISGSSRGLRPLGIDMKDGGKQAENFASALEQIERGAEDLTVEAQGLGDQLFQLKNTFDTLAGVMWTASQEQGGFGAFADVLGGLNTAMGDTAKAIDKINNLVPEMLNPINMVSLAWLQFKAALPWASDEDKQEYQDALAGYARTAAMRARLGITGGQQSTREAAMTGGKQPSARAAPQQTRPRRGASGTGARALTDDDLIGGFGAETERDREAQFFSDFGAGVNEDTLANETALNDIWKVRADILMENREDELSFAESFAETWTAGFAGIADGAWAAATATNTLKNAWYASVDAVIDGSKSIGPALQAILGNVARAVAKEAGLKALLEAANAIADHASQNHKAAAKHWAAAAAYGAVALVAGGIASAAGKASGTQGHRRREATSESGFNRFGERTGPATGAANVGGQTTINVSLELDGEQVHKSVMHHNERSSRAGRDSFATA